MPIERNGPVTSGTRRNLIEGIRAAPMSEPAVDAILQQAIGLTELLVDTYSAEIAEDEVGSGGSGQASDDSILAASPPRVLLYGRVQSGKTAAMILTSALCLDNGFRVVVVLTSDNVALVRQTAARFRDVDGPRVFAAWKDGSSYEWEGQEEQLREIVATEGIVLVSGKNAFNLPQVIRFLQQIDASAHPVLVFDDEADAATPDTTIAARSAARPNAPQRASTINRLVIENDDPNQEGFSLGEALPHSLYVQVTATPYVLLLQRSDASIRPTAHFLLEPGEGYCGGEVFFGRFDPRPGAEQLPPIVLVGDNEAALMRRQVPQGFARSIDFFILAACARAQPAGWPSEGFKHLSHTSHRIVDHDVVLGHIESHLNEIRDHLRGTGQDPLSYFTDAYEELRRAIDDCPSLVEIIENASRAIRQVDIIRVNSESDVPTYGPRLNFLVGGNILGRGLTIDDLLVTYYIREARTSQMDTVWQHARMYGYRRPYFDYMRIYLPRRLAARFRQIHEAEESLRHLLRAGADPVLIEVPRASRATRPNALEAGVLRTLDAGRDQIFPRFLASDPQAAMQVLDILNENGVPVSRTARSDRAVNVPLDAALDLIFAVPVDADDPGLWQPDTISALLESFAEELAEGCVVYARQLDAEIPQQGWVRGRLGGPEITLIRRASPNKPALALLYRGDSDAPTAWYPTLVMPPNTPAYVFSGL